MLLLFPDDLPPYYMFPYICMNMFTASLSCPIGQIISSCAILTLCFSHYSFITSVDIWEIKFPPTPHT